MPEMLSSITTSTTTFFCFAAFITSAVLLVASAASSGVDAQVIIPPWMLGDESTVACYFNNQSEIAPIPRGFGMAFVKSIPTEMDSASSVPVSYSLTIDAAAFLADPVMQRLLGGTISKYRSLLALSETPRACLDAPASQQKDECLVWHSNIHSCRADTGNCLPFVVPQNSSKDGAVLVTHTGSQVGHLGPFSHQLRLPEGNFIIIAHIKLGDLQCAIGARRNVAAPAPPSGLSRSAIIGIAVGFGVCAMLAVVAVSAFLYQRWAKTRYAPKPGDTTFTTMFVVVNRAAHMWEVYSHAMPSAMRKFSAIVYAAASSCGCHVAKKLGDSYCIVSKEPSNVVRCAARIVREVDDINWEDDVFFAGEEGQALLREIELEAARCQARRMRKRNTLAQCNAMSDVSSDQGDFRSDAGSDAPSSAPSEGGDPSRNQNLLHGVEARIHVSCGIRTLKSGGAVEEDEHDEQLEYGGAVVDQAATIVDFCWPDQIIMCEQTLNRCVGESSGGEEIADSSVNLGARVVQRRAEAVTLFQMNVPGLLPPAMMHKHALRCDQIAAEASSHRRNSTTGAHDDGEVGVASQLQAAKMGVTRRRCTILVGHIIGLNARSRAADTETFRNAQAAMFGGVAAVIKKRKGQVLSLEGGRIVVVWNAFDPAPSHASKASLCALEVRDTCKRIGGFDFCCGIATGTALCGNMFPRRILSGFAAAASAAAKKRSDEHARGGDEALTAVTVGGDTFFGGSENGSTGTPTGSEGMSEASATVAGSATAVAGRKNAAASAAASAAAAGEMHRDVVGQCATIANELAQRALAATNSFSSSGNNSSSSSSSWLLQMPAPLSDIETHVYSAIIDIASVLDEQSNNNSNSQCTYKRELVVSLLGIKEDKTSEKDSSEEWRNEIADEQARDPHAVANSMLKTILSHGSLADRREFLRRLNQKVAEENTPSDGAVSNNNNNNDDNNNGGGALIPVEKETEAELCAQTMAFALPKSPGLRKLREILTHQGGIDSWLNSLQPLCGNL